MVVSGISGEHPIFFSSFLCFLVKVLEKALWNMQDDESLWLAYTQEPNRALSKLGTELQLHGSGNRCCEYSTHILLPLPLPHRLPDFNCSTYISLLEVFQSGCTTVHFQQRYPRFQLPLNTVITWNCQVLFFLSHSDRCSVASSWF